MRHRWIKFIDSSAAYGCGRMLRHAHTTVAFARSIQVPSSNRGAAKDGQIGNLCSLNLDVEGSRVSTSRSATGT
jgi:hypothetical protein